MFILDAVNDIYVGTLSIENELRSSRHLERSMSVQKNTKGLCIFLFRSICGAEYFHSVHLALRSWTLCLQER